MIIPSDKRDAGQWRTLQSPAVSQSVPGHFALHWPLRHHSPCVLQ